MCAWWAESMLGGSIIFGTSWPVPAWLAVLGAALAIASTAGAAWAVSRSAALRSSQELIVAANRELRDELAQEKERRAQLEGRLDVLMSGLAERIIAAVADTWHRAHESAAGGTNGG